MGWWHHPSSEWGPANCSGSFVCSLHGSEGSPARQRLAVLFVLPAQLEEQDRPLWHPACSRSPGLPPCSPACAACSWLPQRLVVPLPQTHVVRSSLPLRLLNRSHDRGRGSGRLTEHRPGALQERPGHPHAGTASTRLLYREKDIALKFSAGCLCKYPPPLSFLLLGTSKGRTRDVQE